MKVLIIEDEAPAQRILRRFIQDVPELELVEIANNAILGRQILQTQTIDLLFLDINLPKLTGLELLDSLKRTPLVILTTAYSEYALASYEFSVVDYLLKPFTFVRFLQAVDKAKERQRGSRTPAPLDTSPSTTVDHITVKVDKVIHRVLIEEICYLKAEGDFVRLVLHDRTLLVSQPLSYFADLLRAHCIIQIHRSYLLRAATFRKLEGNQIHTTKGILPLSRSYRAAFLQLIQ